MKVHKKLYTIIVSAIIVAVVGAGVFIYFLSNQGTVSNALELGNEYLSELDYDSAIREYSRVLTLDTLNQEAMKGLAKSYAGQGNLKMAESIIENELADVKDPEVLRAYAEALEDHEQYRKAMDVVSSVVDITDDDEDHEWLEKLIGKYVDSRHDYAGSDYLEISLRNGEVYTKGTNILGALGTENNLGENMSSLEFQLADFSGSPKQVYVTGTGTAVIDENNSLWLAGSNRSGQQANEKIELIAKQGWQKVTTLSNVVKVVGCSGALFALTRTGDVYMIGSLEYSYTGREWLGTWTRLDGYGKICDLQSNEHMITFMTVDGKVYANAITSWNSGTARWTCIAKDVEEYAVSAASYSGNIDILFYTKNGTIDNSYSRVAIPESWMVTEGYDVYYAPSFTVRDIAYAGNSMFLLDDEGKLYWVKEGIVQNITMNGEIESIYTSGDKCVIQLKESGYELIDEAGIIQTI